MKRYSINYSGYNIEELMTSRMCLNRMHSLGHFDDKTYNQRRFIINKEIYHHLTNY